MSGAPIVEGEYRTEDGIRLYYRDYPADSNRIPVLCLHGLTRNSRDFEPLAEWLAGSRRIIAPDMRGRGESEYDAAWSNYNPYRYVEDVFGLLDKLRIKRVICVGTSLGGWMTAIMAYMRPELVAAAVINDIWPELDPKLARKILPVIANRKVVKDWGAAVAQTKELFDIGISNLPETTWRWYTANTFREIKDGTIDLNFDHNIGVASRAGVSGLRHDAWDLFDALKEVPTIVLRGTNANKYNKGTIDKMLARYPRMQSVVVTDCGEVPLLNEPGVAAAISGFLETVDAA